jgi:tetratricopeptide (TPR) repeat protein
MQKEQAMDLLEVGKLYRDRGDVLLGIKKIESAAEIFLHEHDPVNYIHCINILLRMLAETEQFDRINAVKERLQDLVIKESISPNSKTYYTLALCASYKDQYDVALDYLHKSMALALANDSKLDLCYAVSGFAIVYSMQGRFSDALKEIDKLYVFFQVIDAPELRVWTLLNHSQILARQKEYGRALELLWTSYDQMRTMKVLHLHIFLLYSIGWVYLQSGERDLARLYINLAAKTVDPKNMKRLARQINEAQREIGLDENKKFDLVFDLENHSVIERRLGRVDFKNQYILLDLLKLFVQNQGQVYSKEYLVENVWKQPYDPAVHDNKVYVTIKRLRKLIEPDFDRPRYIFRAKNGYYMNKSAKILMDPKLGVETGLGGPA